MKKIMKYLLVFCTMIFVFCIALTLTSLIPQKYIETKVIESSDILNKETNKLMIYIPYKNLNLMFDNYTDALMINTIYSVDSSTPFYSSMVARKNYIKDITEVVYPDTNGELKSSSKYQILDQVGDLKDTVNKNTTESFEYARYWHGYMVLLRPLLIFFNITQIRLLLLNVFVLLAIILLYKIAKKINIYASIIFFLGMIIADYFYIGISLQGSPVFLITMISSLIIISEKFTKNNGFLFLVVGGLTSFLDFLTVPMITLTMPLILYILLQQKKENMQFDKICRNMINYIIIWGIGYCGTFIAKWIIIDLIYHKEVILSAMRQFTYRSGSDENIKYTLLSMFNRIFIVIGNSLCYSLIIVILMIFFKTIYSKKMVLKFNIKKIIPYIFIIVIEIMWYSILKNHSYFHVCFTYRNFFALSICFFLILYNIIEVHTNK